MAENQQDRSQDDLTEEASPHRVEEFRQKGMVSQSREISALTALLAAGVATYALSPTMGTQLSEFMREVFRADLASRLNLSGEGVARTYLIKALQVAATAILPICFAGFIFGALASFAQIGAIFSLDPLQPDMGKLNPLTGFKKIFSIKSGYDALRLTFKLATVGSVAYWFVKKEVMGVPLYIANEPASLLPIYAHVGKAIFLSMIVVLFIFAGIDFGLQRWDYSKKMKMTKQEAKQEHKEREGDPQIKARIRSVQREIARRRMMSAVKKADVVITNPTHIAVAITYDKDNMLAPKVVAKGADFIAQKIKAIATEAGVPMVENVPLARTLFKSVKINQYVPRVLYQAVAEVLAYVYRLKNRKF